MNPDGSDKKQLTTEALVTDLDWSPDGRKIAFDYHMIDVVNSDIHVIDVQNRK